MSEDKTMDAIQEILSKLGVESVAEMEMNEMHEIEAGDNFDPLTIEKVRDDVVSVGHFYKQHGDLMADPEIRFRVEDDGTWTPISYRVDPFVYDHHESGLDEVQGFASDWSKNLRKQGFVEAAGGEKPTA